MLVTLQRGEHYTVAIAGPKTAVDAWLLVFTTGTGDAIGVQAPVPGSVSGQWVASIDAFTPNRLLNLDVPRGTAVIATATYSAAGLAALSGASVQHRG